MPTDRLTKRQKEAAVALLERAGEWTEFDRREFRYVAMLCHRDLASLNPAFANLNEAPKGLTFEARLRPDKIEETRHLIDDEPAPKVRISYEVHYLSPIGGKTVVEPAVSLTDAFFRAAALTQDPVIAIPNTIEVIEVSRKRIA